MTPKQLEDILKEKGFKGEKRDSGWNHTKTIGPIKLICYVEPGIEVEFISIYSWNNNDVKGTYNLPITKLNAFNGDIVELFRKTKYNLPKNIGLTIDTHMELENALESISQIPVMSVRN